MTSTGVSARQSRARTGLLGRLEGTVARIRGVLDAARGAPVARAVVAAATRLDREGALVFADVPGWPRPPLIHGFVPSVYAVFTDRELVLQVMELRADSAEPDHRRRRAFRAWAAAAPEREHEILVV